MPLRIRVAGGLWLIVGTALSLWGFWELVTSIRILVLSAPGFILLVYGLLAAFGGLLLYQGAAAGRVTVLFVSCLGLLYSILMLLIGGFEVAFSNQPGIVLFAAICITNALIRITPAA